MGSIIMSSEEKISISGRELTALTPDVIEKLRSQHGVTLNLVSPKPGLANILSNIPEIGWHPNWKKILLEDDKKY